MIPFLLPSGAEGTLVLPDGTPVGVVLFAHGSGSSRHSPRNAYVAKALRRANLATLLFDLLSPAEAEDRRNVFDIGLLATRLQQATIWVGEQAGLNGVPIGYFGASTGAAAALVAAAALGDRIAAIVSRGGRVDLAGSALPRVLAPTLLIVGEDDTEVLMLNEQAQDRMHCPSELHVVPGATHLFEEPGTLEQAVAAARAWFLRYLRPQAGGIAIR